MSDNYVTTLRLEDGSEMDVHESDLDGPNGKRTMPNRVFYEAKAAMERALEERIANNQARRTPAHLRAPSLDEP